MKLIQGDCLDKLKELDDNSVDSIVTDPPYGLSFMGKKWDYDVPSQAIWEECIRVLKPGGHLLAFAGSRTYHRMAVRIEDAGFEIRDQIMWIYGSGFPKSHNIGKAIDKKDNPETWKNNEYGGGNYKCPNCDKWIISGNPCKCPREVKEIHNEWKGWGTALKPAHEPIVMARKPFKGNVAQNVLEWGTGGINIDDSRIEYSADDHVMKYEGYSNGEYKSKYENGTSYKHGTQVQINPEGRFPANIIFDQEAGKLLDGQCDGASRFFYCPKTSKKDRNEENIHPTVKPTDLMLYLIRLVTPKDGIVLDPFMGSGSTGKAAVRGGFDFIGIEREDEYMEISKNRIKHETDSSRLVGRPSRKLQLYKARLDS